MSQWKLWYEVKDGLFVNPVGGSLNIMVSGDVPYKFVHVFLSEHETLELISVLMGALVSYSVIEVDKAIKNKDDNTKKLFQKLMFSATDVIKLINLIIQGRYSAGNGVE
jgi:hypothetical protein